MKKECTLEPEVTSERNNLQGVTGEKSGSSHHKSAQIKDANASNVQGHKTSVLSNILFAKHSTTESKYIFNLR